MCKSIANKHTLFFSANIHDITNTHITNTNTYSSTSTSTMTNNVYRCDKKLNKRIGAFK